MRYRARVCRPKWSFYHQPNLRIGRLSGKKLEFHSCESKNVMRPSGRTQTSAVRSGASGSWPNSNIEESEIEFKEICLYLKVYGQSAELGVPVNPMSVLRCKVANPATTRIGVSSLAPFPQNMQSFVRIRKSPSYCLQV